MIKEIRALTKRWQQSCFNLREGWLRQIGWLFGKVPNGGRGSFSIQRYMLQILGTLNRAFWAGNWYKRVISGFRVCFFNNCIEKNQNKTHFEEGSSSHTSLRDRSRYQIGWIFRKVTNSSWPQPPTPQNGPHLWISCACISYYHFIRSDSRTLP